MTTENDKPLQLSQERSTPTKKTINLSASSKPTIIHPTPKHIYTPTLPGGGGGFKSMIGKPMSAPQTTNHSYLESQLNDTIKALAYEKRECDKWRKSALTFQHKSHALTTEINHLKETTVPDLTQQVKTLSQQAETLNDMYKESCEKSVQLWDQVDHDQHLIEEYNQLITDAVNENEALRLWVAKLGGDPENDLQTLEEFKHLVISSNRQHADRV